MIPFSPPTLTEDDINAVVEVLRSGWITSGPVGRRFEEQLAQWAGTSGAVALSSATAALELALRAAGAGPGDEVVVPAYTYTASASVIDHVGARIVMVDSEPGSPFPSVERIAAAVTDRTRAVITVDLAGIPFDSRPLATLLAGRGRIDTGLGAALGRPVIISDSAHSLGASLEGTPAGSLADLTAFSFHAVKNLTTAEGGALTWRADLPTDREELARWVRTYSLHGQTKDALAKSRGASWEYDVIAPAYKCNLPDTLAALGLSQLGRYEQTLRRRRELLAHYAQGLADTGVQLLEHGGDGVVSSGHLAIATLPVPGVTERNRVIQDLYAAGVSANVHYKPLPLLTAYRDLGFDIADFPHAYAFYTRELTLPLHLALSDADVDRVCAALAGSLRHISHNSAGSAASAA
ncbi:MULTISPECIES: DegT/DnrJ/EryC1/StrS aminotransferase family protein [unclassified Actinomyces]|uniref:DegT/DnrJ/EryC1/StrS family aminotransferase n=1 Tax=unclassified Actinomyces TaxID=2609248 RepID=UPI000D58E9B2|nr:MULTISPECIES: DegT/DnrJ/EryC1/StrS aminotransferase family protein [unclassified Actinomyces]RAX23551.1 DegT/DnrJ/EryC1/StrS aminotransferase family protein [Actinomyces sp. Z3]